MERLECVQYYLDNLLILSNDSFEDHMNKVDTALSRLNQASLKVRAKKCNFGMTELEYLGFVISRKEIKPMAKKSKLHLMLNS